MVNVFLKFTSNLSPLNFILGCVLKNYFEPVEAMLLVVSTYCLILYKLKFFKRYVLL